MVNKMCVLKFFVLFSMLCVHLGTFVFVCFVCVCVCVFIAMAVRKSLSVLVELYKKNVWRDAKLVNIIADHCCFHKNSAVIRNALHFMLGLP